MKEICRDFILSIEVPDNVQPENCQIVILETHASYIDDFGIPCSIPNENVDISAEDPYLHEE